MKFYIIIITYLLNFTDFTRTRDSSSSSLLWPTVTGDS